MVPVKIKGEVQYCRQISDEFLFENADKCWIRNCPWHLECWLIREDVNI